MAINNAIRLLASVLLVALVAPEHSEEEKGKKKRGRSSFSCPVLITRHLL